MHRGAAEQSAADQRGQTEVLGDLAGERDHAALGA